jgi:hypothetical protein
MRRNGIAGNGLETSLLWIKYNKKKRVIALRNKVESEYFMPNGKSDTENEAGIK